ncbi:uncharacterized protein LOC118433081 [Folsomia candida]|uniref:uncharacterized protein LOC118433081 n=1 Tax=Folsomia candida TaxID=158441 RepID=UPI0016054F03|nr:uncharacterized protein LOC118433081 [Folsomia candida]
MTKLVRVCNLARGKKLIISSGDYEQFLRSVKTKFQVETDNDIILEDDHGAEVDEEVFPILLDQGIIPAITFKIVGEDAASDGSYTPQCQQIYYINSPAPISPQSPATPASPQGEDYFKQALESYIERKPDLKELVSNCNAERLVDSAAATKLINDFVSVLIDLRGDLPSTSDQLRFAKAIIEIIPCWKYPDSIDGIDILYDTVNRSGLIQTRLRWIHRNVKEKNPLKSLKRPVASGAGAPISNKQDGHVQIAADDIAIAELNSSLPEDEVRRLMIQTLEHRNYLRGTNENSVLRVYRKFLECGFLINFEFQLMFPANAAKFLDTWETLREQILTNCKRISKSTALHKFINDNAGNWDRSTGALLALLYLIPPTAHGRGKGARCKIEDAESRLVKYFKSGTPLQSILDTWDSDISQPTLVYLGDDKTNPSTFFIICDKLALPLNASNSTEATDSLFKAHYVIGTKYDQNLDGLWKFMQIHVFQLDIQNTTLPRKAKQVLQQLSSLSESN